MIDLTFGDGAAGALMQAAETSGTTYGEILPLTQALDVGRLSGADGWQSERRGVLELLYGFFPSGAEVVDGILAQNRRTLARLEHAQASGEPVRAWVCGRCPGEICGLTALCAGWTAPLYAVFVPAGTIGQDGMACRSCGDLTPLSADALAASAVQLGDGEKRACGAVWAERLRADAPLRIAADGRIEDAAEDRYDAALLAALPDGTFTAALAIGRTMLAEPGARDGYLYRRLAALVHAGVLQQIRAPEPDNPYAGVLQRTAGR